MLLCFCALVLLRYCAFTLLCVYNLLPLCSSSVLLLSKIIALCIYTCMFVSSCAITHFCFCAIVLLCPVKSVKKHLSEPSQDAKGLQQTFAINLLATLAIKN